MKKIGIVGAGIMASGMAQNFLKHGYEVSVWNRSYGKLQPLLDAGAEKGASPKAVTEASDIVIECVSDDDASRSVWLGEQGILAGATNNKVLITSASLSLAWTDEVAKLCAEKGFQFLDMPLTGSRYGAENGKLKLLVGGDKEVLDSIKSDLEAIADKVYYFGPAGSGMRFKLVLNSLIAIHINAAAQAAELARKAGIAPESLAHALFDGPMGPASPSTKLMLQNVDKDEIPLNFAIRWLEKDLSYAKQMAAAYGVDFDLLNQTQADYDRAKQTGLADRDLTAIVELYKESK